MPAAAWGVLIEYQGWLCPLTPWEQQLRQAGGVAGYSSGFIEHYLLPVLYPVYLNRAVQTVLGTFVIEKSRCQTLKAEYTRDKVSTFGSRDTSLLFDIHINKLRLPH
ncbi:MAG: DUF2784 domain-containing protein [Candidatus Scalindua sp.]